MRICISCVASADSFIVSLGTPVLRAAGDLPRVRGCVVGVSGVDGLAASEPKQARESAAAQIENDKKRVYVCARLCVCVYACARALRSTLAQRKRKRKPARVLYG